MEFKDLVYTRRKTLNMSMSELAKKAGVSKATVQRWESGEIKNIRRDKISKLANALETTPAYLMGWDNEIKEKKQDCQTFTLETLMEYTELESKITYSSLSNLCKLKRIEKDWTKKKLANLACIDINEYLRFENYGFQLEIAKVGRILNALNISIEFVLGFISAMIALQNNKIK